MLRFSRPRPCESGRRCGDVVSEFAPGCAEGSRALGSRQAACVATSPWDSTGLKLKLYTPNPDGGYSGSGDHAVVGRRHTGLGRSRRKSARGPDFVRDRLLINFSSSKRVSSTYVRLRILGPSCCCWPGCERGPSGTRPPPPPSCLREQWGPSAWLPPSILTPARAPPSSAQGVTPVPVFLWGFAAPASHPPPVRGGEDPADHLAMSVWAGTDDAATECVD